MFDDEYSYDDGEVSSSAYTGAVTPPIHWLFAALVAGSAGLTLAFLGRDAVNHTALPLLAFIGWALAGPIGMLFIAFYMTANTKRRASIYYDAGGTANLLYWLDLALLLLAVVACALVIAFWAGRL